MAGSALLSCLFISELQHTFARELKDTRAEERGKVTLECETRQPAKRVTWLKGLIELRPGRKYVIRQKGVVLSLAITSLDKSDTDIYICDVGTMQSRAQLTVQGERGSFKSNWAISGSDGKHCKTKEATHWEKCQYDECCNATFIIAE